MWASIFQLTPTTVPIAPASGFTVFLLGLSCQADIPDAVRQQMLVTYCSVHSDSLEIFIFLFYQILNVLANPTIAFTPHSVIMDSPCLWTFPGVSQSLGPPNS